MTKGKLKLEELKKELVWKKKLDLIGFTEFQKRKSDKFNNELTQRERRISITFRKVII